MGITEKYGYLAKKLNLTQMLIYGEDPNFAPSTDIIIGGCQVYLNVDRYKNIFVQRYLSYIFLCCLALNALFNK